MKITGVRARPYEIQLRRRIADANNPIGYDRMAGLAVQLDTDAGVTGVALSSPGVRSHITGMVDDLLVGRDPRGVRGHWKRMMDTTFKGGVQTLVVRERGKSQARFASTVRVRAGDRLRLEVALDREQAILAGVLSDDGKYLELMPQAVRGPGTHLSERSARVDDAPTYGTIVLGTPEAIARVRETKRIEGVATLRVEWEGSR